MEGWEGGRKGWMDAGYLCVLRISLMISYRNSGLVETTMSLQRNKATERGGVISTRDGHLFLGDIEVVLGCHSCVSLLWLEAGAAPVPP